jgi:predicted RNA-binding protein with PIN domain
MTHYLVDGHNLILTTRALTELLESEGERASREGAEALILAWARRKGGVRVRLIYDGQDLPKGHPGSRDDGPLAVRFADPPLTADDRILQEAEVVAKDGAAVVVVTGDKELGRQAARVGARVMDIHAFYRLLIRPREELSKEDHLSDEEKRDLVREILGMGGVKEIDTAPGCAAGQPARPPSRPGQPPVSLRLPKEERRRRYREKAKNRLAKKTKPKSRKKRRGY